MRIIGTYGTLRKGWYNNYILKDTDAKYIGTGILKGYKMYYITEMYPAIIEDHKGECIVELYRVDESAYYVIDELETAFNYREEKVMIEINGNKIEASVYVYNDDIIKEHKEVEGGDWNTSRRNTN